MLNLECLWVCTGGGRCRYKDEVDKKLGTCLTMMWELGVDLVGQPRELINSSLKCHYCGKSSFPPSPHLGWLVTFSQVCVHSYSCAMMLWGNMSLSILASNL